MNDLKRITIDLPHELHTKIKVIAAQSGRSVRCIIIELIEKLSAELKENASYLEKE